MTDATSPKLAALRERRDWLKEQLEELALNRAQATLDAEKHGSGWTPVTLLAKELRTHRQQFDQTNEAILELEATLRQQSKGDLTPEEWSTKNREDAEAATDEALELYVAEWLRRRRYLLLVEEGELRLERLAS